MASNSLKHAATEETLVRVRDALLGVESASEGESGTQLQHAATEETLREVLTAIQEGGGGGGGGGITEIPVATADTLGGIKVGVGLEIEEDGTLNAHLMQPFTVTLAKNYGEGAVTGVTVSIRAGSATAKRLVPDQTYDGQPITIPLMAGQAYYVSVSPLANYVTPTPETGYVGAAGTTVVMTYVASAGDVPIWDPERGQYEDSSVARWVASWADGLAYGVSMPKGSATACTKTGANAGVANPTPGWVGSPGVDPYATIAPFRHVEVNGFVDADGTPHVTGIQGDGRYARDGSNGDVWILAPNLWWSVAEDSESVTFTVSDVQLVGMSPQPQAYLPDGTRRPYMLYAKYAGTVTGAGTVAGEMMHSYSGRESTTYTISHDTLVTLCRNGTTGYSAKSVADDWYVKVMFLLKYATKDSQSVYRGAADYNFSYSPAIAETGVSRVILTNAQAGNLVVGSTVTLGTANNGTQVLGKTRIASIEPYDESYRAINLDTSATFDTKTNQKLSTASWHSGSCDGVSGDGTPTQLGTANGKEPFVLQGIECMVGCNEVLGQVIIVGDGTTQVPYVNPNSRYELPTDVTEHHVRSTMSLPYGTGDGWRYPMYATADPDEGLIFGTTTGASQTTGLCDGHYVKKATTTGRFEWLGFGVVNGGSGAGLFCVHGSHAVADASWSIGSRLSGTGRGREAA